MRECVYVCVLSSCTWHNMSLRWVGTCRLLIVIHEVYYHMHVRIPKMYDTHLHISIIHTLFFILLLHLQVLNKSSLPPFTLH